MHAGCWKSRGTNGSNLPPKAHGRLRAGNTVLAGIIVLVTSSLRSPVALETLEHRKREKEVCCTRIKREVGEKRHVCSGQKAQRLKRKVDEAPTVSPSLSPPGSSAQLRPSSSNLASSVDFSTSLLCPFPAASRFGWLACSDRQKS